MRMVAYILARAAGVSFIRFDSVALAIANAGLLHTRRRVQVFFSLAVHFLLAETKQKNVENNPCAREGLWYFHVVSNNQPHNKMNKHHEISAASFSAKTLKALAKKGLFLASSTFIPGPDGSFANGESAFLVSDGRLLTWIQIYKLAGV